MSTRYVVFYIVFLVVAAGNGKAVMLEFSFTNPVGDEDLIYGSPVVPIDVVGLDFSFDNTTGDYTIRLLADLANPFDGHFRVNVNLYNPDAGVTIVPGDFSSTLNDISVSSPTTLVTLTGTNTNLLMWQEGDRVAIGTAAFGNPTDAGFTIFGSGVSQSTDDTFSNFNGIDYISQDGGFNGQSTDTAIINYVDCFSLDYPLDVDGNNNYDALSDGLLIIRYLFGFKGDALIDGAVSPNCTRCTAPEVEAYLKVLTP